MRRKRVQQRLSGLDFVGLARSNREGHEPAPALDQRGDFGVESAFGAPDSLGALPSGGIGRELVALDVGAVDKTHAALGPAREQRRISCHSPSAHQRRQRV